jgi:hypothetical protein
LKKVETKVASGKNNGGIHSVREYKKSLQMIDLCAKEYKKAEMYHLGFVELDSQNIETERTRTQEELRLAYRRAITELVRRLRRYRIPCEWRGAFVLRSA